MIFFRTFRNLIGLNLALVALLPLLIFGLGVIFYLEQNRIDELEEEYLFLASEAAVDITYFLDKEIQILRAIDNMHENGRETPQIIDTLKNFQFDDSLGFEAILILNRAQKVEHILSSTYDVETTNNLLGLDLSRNSLFQMHLQPGEIRFSGVHLSPLSEQLTVSLVLATHSGFLFANMSLESVYKIIERFAKDRYAEFAVLDNNGVLIAHTDKSLFGQRLNFRTHPEVIRGLSVEAGGWSEIHTGLNVLEGMVQIPVANWLSWVSVDLDQALLVNNRVRNAMYLLMGTMLVFAGTLALYFGRVFYQPLKRLDIYSKKVGAGEYDALATSSRFVEFESLETSFSDMALLLKERELRLQMEKARFKNVMQASPLGMLLIECTSDGKMVLLEGNPTLEAIFGVEVGAKHGEDLFVVLPKLFTSGFPDYLAQVSRNYELWEPRELVFSSDSCQQALEVLAFKTDENMIACTFQDVSERRFREKEEQARNASETLLASISSSLTEAEYGSGVIYSVCQEALGNLASFIGAERSHLLIPHEDGPILSCVANWCKDGVSPSTVVGDTISLVDFPWFAEKFNCSDVISYSCLDLLPSAGSDKTFLEQRQALSMLVVPLLTSGGDYSALTLQTVSLERDWSEADSSLAIRAGAIIIRAIERELYTLALKQRESQYRRLNLEFQTILHGIGADISLWTADRKLIWSNRDATDLSSDRFVHCFETGEHGNTCEDCLMNKCLRDLIPQEKLLRRDGRQWGVKYFPVRDETSDEPRIICVANDVTEKIQLREAAERSSRLASLGQIAAGVAHEINNPNALVLMNSSIIKDVMKTIQPMLDDRFEKEGDFKLGKLSYSRLRDRLPGMISDLESSAQRVRAIVNDMKGYISRGDTLQDDAIDLNDVVQTALQLVINTTNTPSTTVQFDAYENLPGITGNFQRLEQVIINLLINAIQSLPKADCRVYVSTDVHQGDGTVSLTVRDEGIGIPEDQLSQISDPFFTTKRDDGGTGLGLSVSVNIIKDHGGVLLFDSVVDEGTTATIRLPYNG